jgi:hypothetical protein
MKLVLTLAVMALTTTAFPSGSTVGNGLVAAKDPKEIQAKQEKLCEDKGGKVKKEDCVMKDKTVVKLSDLVEDAPKAEAPKAEPKK